MNIIYLGTFRLPNYDAAAARVLGVAKALRESGHRVSFISWGGRYQPEDKAMDGVYRTSGFQYIITNELDAGVNFRTKLKGVLSRGRVTKQLLNNWPEKIDVIITYNGSLIYWLLKFCKRNGIKLINDMTEWYSYAEQRPAEWIPYAYNMLVVQKRVANKIVISSYLNRYYSKTHNVIVPATSDGEEAKWCQKLDWNWRIWNSAFGVR